MIVSKALVLSVLFASLISCASCSHDSQRMVAAFEQARLVYSDGENDTVLLIPELDKASAHFASKKQYDKAALSALYHGYAEMNYGKTEAMKAFKEAEQYGKLINDSLTVARAQYQMGKMLYMDKMEQEAAVILRNAISGFKCHDEERAMAENTMACCQMLLQHFDSAEYYLNKSLEDAHRSQSSKATRKALNNYAILHHLRGDYNKAIGCLRLIHPENDQQRLLNCLNLGDAFAASGEMDSASFYYRLVEKGMDEVEPKDETKIAIYGSFSRLAERQGDYMKALEYHKEHERCIGKLRDKREKKNVYYIQQKYDYESLQREMNEQILHKRLIIMVFCFVLAVALGITLYMYHRYIQKQLREVELNDILLKFMEQNQALVRKDAEHEHERNEMVKQLTTLQKERIKAMQTFEVFLKDRKNVIALGELEKQLFFGRDHWKVMLEFINEVYPGLYEKIETRNPTLSELEKKVFLLSLFKLSRPDEAAILEVSTSVLDKARGRVKRLKSLDDGLSSYFWATNFKQ